MIFGRQPQGHAAAISSLTGKSVQGRMRGLWWLLATLLLILPLSVLAGCGGSSSSSPSTSGGGGANAIITGRLIDEYNNNAPVVGATVNYAGLTAISGTDGTFSIAIASASGGKLTVTSPTAIPYWSTGKYNGTPIDLQNNGVPIPALANAQNYSVGDIVLYSQSGPPPPPLL